MTAMHSQKHYGPEAMSTVASMNWIYWNTFWSLAGSLVWFMTIVSHPDSVVVDRHSAKPRAR